MPNHIKNRVEITGPENQVKKCIDAIGTHYPEEHRRSYDGDLIYKSSKTGQYAYLNSETGVLSARGEVEISRNKIPNDYKPSMEAAFFAFPDFKKVIPPPEDPAYRDEPSQEIAKSSPNWWYKWNLQNWGTKWGGYSFTRKGGNCFEFQTAWSFPYPVAEKIAKDFPELVFDWKYSDEDIGYNCGSLRFVYGNLFEKSEPEGGSIEAYELAFDLRPDRKKHYELVNGEYQYKDNGE